ncbi:protein-glutamate methylesterase/protein-glutamine glutaminase [Lichenihabitans sp. Uapishka_5]|uniref:protein-glutamate methylesterase/protein-glutamine glutaminase n=1 Tax=Lichenihabitans sp. Uapishka_5 TaxID=3037302 RepID=UPI003FA57A7B
MRRLIRAVLERTSDIVVVGEAQDPIEARDAIKVLNPDVVTLDIEMPRMNGLEFLEKIMRLRPTPVIMVSSLTGAGTDATIRALEIGAVDCIAKPEPGERELFAALPDKIRIAAKSRVGSLADRLQSRHEPRAPVSGKAYRPDGSIVAIGSSTGGVEALTAVLSCFPANCPPTVITQHMPPLFTKSFADRLDRLCAPHVAEASDGAPLLEGHVYIAPGSPTHHLEVVGSPGRLRCRLRAAAPVNGHCPSVDVLFQSVAKTAGAQALGVILTGMGRDGATGLMAMRQAGARTLGQDAASALVYGMPKVAFEIGAVERQAPLRRIGHDILTLTTLNTDQPPCHSPQVSR